MENNTGDNSALNNMARKRKIKPTIRIAKNRLESAVILENNITYKEKRRDFIDKFTLCDVSCKALLEGYQRYRSIYTPGKYIALSMKQIPSAIELYGLDIQRNVLNGIFGGSGQYKKRGTKSAKKLRDGIVHAMNSNDVNEVIERYDKLMALMDDFLSYFE